MWRRSSGAWQIHVDEWIWPCEMVLWLRAAEAIDVPAGGLVPGPLDTGPLHAPMPPSPTATPVPPSPTATPVPPSPTATPESATELAEGWLAWWHAVLRQPRPQPPTEPGQPPALPTGFDDFWPPVFRGLRPWPALREVARRRWPQAHEWHSARARAAIAARSFPSLRENDAVRGVRRRLHRRLAPFRLELMVVPVRDDEIRHIEATRYLVPERVYAGAQWPQLLEPLIVRADAVA
jgi:hypothetical protein